MKRSRVGDPTPEGVGTTPEGSLSLVSNLLLVVVNIGLDILGNLTKFNITNIELKLVNFSIERTLKKNTQQLLQTYKNYLI